VDLWQDFLNNNKKPIFKWVHYFPIYERHFASWRNRSMTFLEIGVLDGGSLQMWQRYFGPLAKIVGIDIDDKCKEHESPGIFIRIGDQSDPKFLQSVIEEFGIPDVVLDDGSHQMVHVMASFNFLYPKMLKNATYMVEDLHTAYWSEFGGGVEKPDTFMNFAKGCTDRLNWAHSRGTIAADYIGKETLSISFYDSIVNFEKGDVAWKEALKTGYGQPEVQPREGRSVFSSTKESPAPARFIPQSFAPHPSPQMQPFPLATQTPPPAAAAAAAADAETALLATNASLRDEIDRMRKSTSWRVTSPMRRFKTFIAR